MLVFAASRRNSAENTELFQSNAKTISALEKRLEDLQQTVSRQSSIVSMNIGVAGKTGPESAYLLTKGALSD